MKYRKRPVVIEAHEWSGSITEGKAIASWVNERGGKAEYVYQGEEHHLRYDDEYDKHGATRPDAPQFIVIETMEGSMRMNPGNFAVEGVQQEHYPCDGEVFRRSYEAVEYGEDDS